MRETKNNREDLFDNSDIVGLILIVIANLFFKHYNTGLYMLFEIIGASLIFARIYVQFKLAETKYDKTFYGLAMLAIMIVCLSIFK